MTEEQRELMIEAAKPLIKFLNENCSPHVTALVTPGTIELLEGIAAAKVTEFLKD